MKKTNFRPFTNHDSKVKAGVPQPPSINALTLEDSQEEDTTTEPQEYDDTDEYDEELVQFIRDNSPSISSFIADQSSIAASINVLDNDDDDKPIICSQTIIKQSQPTLVTPFKQPPSFTPYNFTTVRPLPSDVCSTSYTTCTP